MNILRRLVTHIVVFICGFAVGFLIIRPCGNRSVTGCETCEVLKLPIEKFSVSGEMTLGNAVDELLKKIPENYNVTIESEKDVWMRGIYGFELRNECLAKVLSMICANCSCEYWISEGGAIRIVDKGVMGLCE